MAKRMTEEEVVAMLRAKIDRNEVLFMPNCGCGLTAKLQEAGGADLICLSANAGLASNPRPIITPASMGNCSWMRRISSRLFISPL